MVIVSATSTSPRRRITTKQSNTSRSGIVVKRVMTVMKSRLRSRRKHHADKTTRPRRKPDAKRSERRKNNGEGGVV